MANNKTFVVTEVGYFGAGSKIESKELKAGEVGYIAASVKNAKDVQVGDTITLKNNKAESPLPRISRGKKHGILWNVPN